MKKNAKAIIYVLICVALWALIPVVAKLGQADLDNHQFLFWSSVVSFIMLFIITLFSKNHKEYFKYNSKDWLHVTILGFLGTYLYYILLYFGYANAQGIEVLVLQYTWPIFIILLSVIILKEKLNLRRIFAVILGFVGVLLVLTKGDFANIHLENISTDLLVLLAALAFGLFSVLTKKIKKEAYSVTTVYFLVAAVFSFLSMMLLSSFSLPTKESLFPIVINGIFVNGISYIFWVKALRNANASFVAPFIFLVPVLSAIYLIIFFAEPFLFVYGAGLACVIVAGLMNK